jgi:plasmid stabilization system protein ParE
MAKGKPYRVDERAWLELEAANDWYRKRSEDASAAFLLEVYEAFESISQAPHRWPKYLHGTRRYLLRHFPFSIVYLNDPEFVTIAAVAHNKRKPGYWQKRV